MIDAFACEALGCAALTRDSLADCERKRCCFAWQRRGLEDRARRDDAGRREILHLKKEIATPPQNQVETVLPRGGAVPPHGAVIVPVPGGGAGRGTGCARRGANMRAGQP